MDLQWTFNLRQGVHYDDGTEFTADDVKYTFDRGIGIADPDGAFVGIGYGDIIKDVTVVSPYVVRFDLKIPFAAFLSLMACQASGHCRSRITLLWLGAPGMCRTWSCTRMVTLEEVTRWAWVPTR